MLDEFCDDVDMKTYRADHIHRQSLAYILLASSLLIEKGATYPDQPAGPRGPKSGPKPGAYPLPNQPGGPLVKHVTLEP
jgi:hypothetical protein